MTEKKPPDTVRKRKRKIEGTQQYLPIAEIRNDTILLKNGGMRAVLRIQALNFNLKSETEQEAIIAGYGSFTNTIGFPIQIVIRSARADIDTYIAYIQEKLEKQKHPLLREQTAAYMSFILRLLDVADIMQKHFFIIIPLDRSMRKKTLMEKFLEWLHPGDTAVKAAHRSRDFIEGAKVLATRVELVQSGLQSVGLPAQRLTTRELIQLFYQIYNPKTSLRQKIPDDVSQLQFDPATL